MFQSLVQVQYSVFSSQWPCCRADHWVTTPVQLAVQVATIDSTERNTGGELQVGNCRELLHVS